MFKYTHTEKKIKTLNQATIANDKELILEFLKQPKINKRIFKSAIINSIKLNQEDNFYLLFDFNKKNNIIDFENVFFELFHTACSENNLVYVKFLKENFPLKSFILKHKTNNEFKCVENLLMHLVMTNCFESLKFLLTENNQLIKDCLNHKNSNINYQFTIRDLFINACSFSKTSIVKYLFDFESIKNHNDIDFFKKSIDGALNYKKFNTTKFLYNKFSEFKKFDKEFLLLANQKSFYSFFKFLIKENPDLKAYQKEINSGLCFSTSRIHEFNLGGQKVHCEFIEFLIQENIYINFELLSDYTHIEYIKEKFNILATKQKVKTF